MVQLWCRRWTNSRKRSIARAFGKWKKIFSSFRSFLFLAWIRLNSSRDTASTSSGERSVKSVLLIIFFISVILCRCFQVNYFMQFVIEFNTEFCSSIAQRRQHQCNINHFWIKSLKFGSKVKFNRCHFILFHLLFVGMIPFMFVHFLNWLNVVYLCSETFDGFALSTICWLNDMFSCKTLENKACRKKRQRKRKSKQHFYTIKQHFYTRKQHFYNF